MDERIVNSQKEMDSIAVDFDGIIKILGASIIVSLQYKYRVEAWGNSSVVARENSSVVARENSSVVARGNSSVVARENSSVVAWENSSVVARDNSSVEARGQSITRVFSPIKKLSLHGFSILSIPNSLKLKFEHEKTCKIQKYTPQKYLDREGLYTKSDFVVLFKKVSKDFKTQENTANETSWIVGKTITHPCWEPTQQECGSGKFYAVSRPYFADEFRNQKGDRYIAIKIKISDLYEWPNPSYPHKIAFRAGKVLYEVDRFGKKR